MTSAQICICTWNRSAALERTLASLSRLQIPAACDWEILLVDNNSQDNTVDVVRRWQSRLPLTYLKEVTPGHVAARNCAVANSSADLIIWTDDDVEVSSDWLAAYVLAASSAPKYAFFGGRIKPEFEPGCPDWIAENWPMVQGCFAARDLGDQAIEFTAERLPYGANFAVRGDLQRQIRFEPGLGRVGNSVVGNDEIDWMRRALQAGHRGQWVPQGEVKHMIPASRATTDYVYDYFRGQGQVLASQGRSWTRWRWRLAWSIHWHQWNYRRFRHSKPSGRWLAHLIRSALAQGQWDNAVG